LTLFVAAKIGIHANWHRRNLSMCECNLANAQAPLIQLQQPLPMQHVRNTSVLDSGACHAWTLCTHFRFCPILLPKQKLAMAIVTAMQQRRMCVEELPQIITQQFADIPWEVLCFCIMRAGSQTLTLQTTVVSANQGKRARLRDGFVRDRPNPRVIRGCLAIFRAMLWRGMRGFAVPCIFIPASMFIRAWTRIFRVSPSSALRCSATRGASVCLG
jgi:hypothetical protein